MFQRKTHAFILDNDVEHLSDETVDPIMQKQIEEANRFAAGTLIPPDLLIVFVRHGTFTSTSIDCFAEQVAISLGIVRQTTICGHFEAIPREQA